MSIPVASCGSLVWLGIWISALQMQCLRKALS
jgi:hypothetical protein